jgi:hypothetical protein
VFWLRDGLPTIYRIILLRRKYIMGSVEDEVKQLLIDVLQLEDITPANIDTDAPLFVDGLGLDSIDAFERGWLSISVTGCPCRAIRRHHRCVFTCVILGWTGDHQYSYTD